MAAAFFIGRAQWRRRWLGLIGLGILAGVIAGVVIAAVAGIRRTSSALERLVDASNMPTATVEGSPAVDIEAVAARLRAAPGIEHVTRVVPLVGREDVEKNWWMVVAPLDDASTQVLVDGRPPADDAPHEVMISEHTGEKFGLHVGSTFTVDFYSAEQFAIIDFDSSVEPDGPRPELEVVGIYLDPRDVEQSPTSTGVVAGAAFADRYAADGSLSLLAVTAPSEQGAAALSNAVAAVNDALGLSEDFGNALRVNDQLSSARDAERESRSVVVIGLAAFAVAAFAAGVVAHGQAMRRWASRLDSAQAALVAMGLSDRGRRDALTIGLLPHVLVAVGVAILTAWLLSPLFPVGVLRDIEPEPGLRADWLVFALGAIATALVLVLATVVVTALAIRRSGRRHLARSESGLVRVAERASAPLPGLVGLRYALRPGRARVALPVRTAMTATVVAVGGLVATAIFTASLEELESTPERFGLRWDLSMELLSAPTGEEALASVVADPRIADVGVAITTLGEVAIEGRRTNISLLSTLKGDPLLVLHDGRAPAGEGEVALGPRLLDEIGKRVGDTVEVVEPDGRIATQTVVGSTYSIEYQSVEFNSVAMYGDDSGAPPGGFAVVLVRFADGVDSEAMTAELDRRYPFAVMNESFPAPPPEVINLAQLSSLPRALALFLAFLGFASLAHALVVTGRVRRRDLGVLRSLGFTKRQAGGVVLATTGTILAIGLVVGLPLGLLAGTTGWRLVAGGIHVATDGVYPVPLLAAIVGLAVAGALVAAAVPARAAVRIDPADALRAE